MGGGQAKYKKKYSREGKLNGKNSCMPINPKKYSCYSLKKIHTRNLIMKKNSCCSKIRHFPHNFSNGPYLMLELGGILHMIAHVHMCAVMTETALICSRKI